LIRFFSSNSAKKPCVASFPFLGYVPPVEYAAMYYQQQMAPAVVAGVK